MTTISTSNHDNNEPSIPEELSKQLIQLYTPPGGGSGKRIPKETAKAVSEVIRMLVLEARSRASVEAECDAVDEKGNGTFVSIRADHVTKIAVELLMDFC